MANDKLTILMIDDDSDDIAIVRAMLDRVPVWSVDLIACLDVASAAQQASQCKPDLILLDFNFGAASGLDVLPHIRANGYTGPIILLSGCGNEQIASMVIAGLNDFLSKNELSSLTLYHAITLAIEKQQAPARAERTNGLAPTPDRPGLIPSTISSSTPRARYQ